MILTSRKDVTEIKCCEAVNSFNGSEFKIRNICVEEPTTRVGAAGY